MMRKMYKMLPIILILVIVVCTFMACSTKDYDANQMSDYSLGTTVYEYLEEISLIYANRTAGSDESESFIDYISSGMTNLGYTVTEQDFTVTSSSKNLSTTNVICKITNDDSYKTIVIGCQWDNCYDLIDGNPDGAYESGAAIASLVLVAQKLANAQLNYNLEIVFFGGGVYGWSGAQYYLNHLSSDEKNSIALMINLSMLGSGDNLYMYSRDKTVNYNDYFYAVAYLNDLEFTSVPTNKHVIDSQLSTDALYSYTHFGMFGNHYFFMNELIPSISYASFNWSDSSIPGWVEKSGYSNVYETSDDTLSTMLSRVGEEYIINNLNMVVKSVLATVVDNQDELLDILEDADEINSFAQSNIAYYIFSVALKVIAVAAIIIVVMISRNFIKKNKDKYEIKIPTTKKDIVEGEIFGSDNGFDPFSDKKNNNEDIDDDDVFQ